VVSKIEPHTLWRRKIDGKTMAVDHVSHYHVDYHEHCTNNHRGSMTVQLWREQHYLIPDDELIDEEVFIL